MFCLGEFSERERQANLDDDPDSPDGSWATATTVADTSIQTGFPTPPNDPTPGAGLQEFRVLLRKDAAGGNDPTYDIELWESGGIEPLATLVSGATLSSDTGEVVSVTWDASLLGTADGSTVEVRVVGHRSGGNPTKRRTVEVGAVEWNADYQGTPSSELYFLRARFYDPQTGRFLGRDPLPARTPYGYGWNNPVRYGDPTGQWPKVSVPNPLGTIQDKVVDPVVDTVSRGVSDTGTFLRNEVIKPAGDAVVDFVSDPENLASVAQIISGAAIQLTCPTSPTGVGALVCGGAIAVYGSATLAKVIMADSEEEAWIVLGSGLIGYFGAKFDIGGPLGYTLAGLSGAIDASVPTPVEAGAGALIGPTMGKE